MDSVAPEGLIIVSDYGCSAECVLLHILRRVQFVCVVTTSERRLRRTFGNHLNDKWQFVSPSSSWWETSSPVLLLHSGMELLDRLGVDRLSARLHSLAEEVCVLLLLHGECLSVGTLPRLLSIANASIQLIHDNEQIHSTATVYKRNGLPVVTQEEVVVTEDAGRILVKATKKEKPMEAPQQVEQPKGQSIQLPYEEAKTETGIVAVHRKGKVRVGGRVIYSPDEGDDLDDDDPDDDLHL